MNFRDKLARLSAPLSRAGAQPLAAEPPPADAMHAALLEPRVVRDQEPEPGEIVRAIERIADAGAPAEPNPCSSFSPLTKARAAANSGELEGASMGTQASARETDETRAERIAQLRGLIGDVLSRGGAWRAPSAHPARNDTHAAPDFRSAVPSTAFADTSELGSSTSQPHTALAAAIAAAERATASIASAAEIVGAVCAEAGEAGSAEPAPAAHELEHAVQGARLHMLRAAIDGWAPARGKLARVFARQPWATRETPHGPLFLVERWLEPAHHHGNASVHSALERLPATLAALALDPALAELDLSRMLFLDTETTGLAGGSGTVAFLVGIAAFQDDALLVTQLLLPNLGGEVPMLVALAEHLAAASCILTYNGKTFDWPLLRTRYVMNRLAIPALPPHVDLLHATRRIWKPRLGSVRLTDVEREIMRFSREGDVDGAEIPSRYFAFLRDGGSEWLLPVLEHNQNDVIALPAMLGALGERFEQIECGDHPLDALAYGRLALRAADNPRAAAFARAAIKASEGLPLESEAWSFCGEVARRSREAHAAVRHFEQALELSAEAPRQAALHVLLAKLYEHGLRDLRAAYRHARYTEPAEGPELQGRRLGRLTRKLENAARMPATSKASRKRRTAAPQSS
jgi:uncharacterized protein YprB with RNaseH-like and TPR domain